MVIGEQVSILSLRVRIFFFLRLRVSAVCRMCGCQASVWLYSFLSRGVLSPSIGKKCADGSCLPPLSGFLACRAVCSALLFLVFFTLATRSSRTGCWVSGAASGSWIALDRLTALARASHWIKTTAQLGSSPHHGSQTQPLPQAHTCHPAPPARTSISTQSLSLHHDHRLSLSGCRPSRPPPATASVRDPELAFRHSGGECMASSTPGG